MCECGCGEAMAPLFQFPSPDPTVRYAIGLYPGCRECSTPAGVVLYRIPEKEMEHFGGESWPELQWGKLYGWEEIVIPVLDREGLLTAMRERLGGNPADDYDGEGAIEDGAEAFTVAASKSFHDFVRAQEKLRGAPTEPGA